MSTDKIKTVRIIVAPLNRTIRIAAIIRELSTPYDAAYETKIIVSGDGRC